MKLTRLLCMTLVLTCMVGMMPMVQAEESLTVNWQDDRYETSPQTVQVTVLGEAVNTVKSGIFGVNNGYRAGGYGIYNEETLSFNEKMLEAIRNSGVTHIRQPGGIEGDYFHWYECVGPVEERVPQVNPFSTGYPTYTATEGEPYDVKFGPDEWMEACKRTGTALTIQLNSGTGTPQEAVDFIRYCLANGVEIESIAVGNEACMQEERVEGINVTMTPEQYVDYYNEVLALMDEDLWAELKARNIPFGCIGLPSSHSLSIHRKWDTTVLSGFATPADFIDIHIGYSPMGGGNIATATEEAVHLTLLATPNYVRDLLKAEVKSIGSTTPDTLIKMSEFGPIGSRYAYGTAGALFMAGFFQTTLAEPKVFSVDYLPLCYAATSANTLIGADVAADAYWVNVTGYVFQMYASQIGRDVLDVAMENSQQFKAQGTGLIPRILKVDEGVCAVYMDSAAGEGSIFVINRAYSQNTNFDIQLPFENVTLTGVTELWNENYSLVNTRDNPTAVTPVATELNQTVADGHITVSAKPVSLLKIDFTVAK